MRWDATLKLSLNSRSSDPQLSIRCVIEILHEAHVSAIRAGANRLRCCVFNALIHIAWHTVDDSVIAQFFVREGLTADEIEIFATTDMHNLGHATICLLADPTLETTIKRLFLHWMTEAQEKENSRLPSRH